MRALLITFVLLATAGLSNAQSNGRLAPDVAEAVEALPSPALTRSLRARAQVHHAVARMTSRLGLTDSIARPLLAQNSPRRIASR